MKKIINTDKAPLSTSPVSQCNIINNTIYIGGQMPRDMDKAPMDELIEQTKLSLDHCIAILEEAGGSIETIALTMVYCGIYLLKMKSIKFFLNIFPLILPLEI